MAEEQVTFENRAAELIYLYEDFQVNDYPSPRFGLADVLLLLESGRAGTKVKRDEWPEIETLTYAPPVSGTVGLKPSKELGIKIDSPVVFEPYILKRYSNKDFAVWTPQPYELFAKDYVFVRRYTPSILG